MGNAVGFIYLIRDPTTKKLYLGKKLYRVMKGKTKGKESNWRVYQSSSKLVKELVKTKGKDKLEFFCVAEYNSKGSLAYAETWSLCHVHAVTTDVWMNTRIDKISWKVTEEITSDHISRLQKIINWEI